MSTDKVQKIIEKELEEENSLEEIYVKYDNLYRDELEKMTSERNEQKKKEYMEIRDSAGKSIVVGALIEKGYKLVSEFPEMPSRWKRRRTNNVKKTN